MNSVTCKRNIYFKIGQYISPNAITVIRGVVALIAILPWVWYPDTMFRFSILVLWGVCWACDALDGAVARASNQVSESGKALDPMVDKVQFYVCIFVFWENIWLIAVGILFFLDAISTVARYVDKEGGVKGAVGFGKQKTVIAVIAFFVLGLGAVFQSESAIYLANMLICTAIIFAILSLRQRYGKKN